MILQNKHLGAPEVATDMAGQIIWQGPYTAFGKLGGATGAYSPKFPIPSIGCVARRECGCYTKRFLFLQFAAIRTFERMGIRSISSCTSSRHSHARAA
jgi:hypothetical protein